MKSAKGSQASTVFGIHTGLVSIFRVRFDTMYNSTKNLSFSVSKSCLDLSRAVGKAHMKRGG